MATEQIDYARAQAAAQLESIVAMTTRLDHARDASNSVREHMEHCDFAPMCEECDGTGLVQIVDEGQIIDAECPNCDGLCATWDADAFDGLTFDEYHDEDDASEAIDEDPLEVQVRSGWTQPGADFEAEDFAILLCTGGPAVRIRGELSDGDPSRAWIEYQDWGTPWREYHGSHDLAALLAYAGHFLGS